MGDLSENFSKREFLCPHCKEGEASARLIYGLQQLRDRVGKPIRVNSGFRCPVHNEAVGGAKGSQHLFGNAADIVIVGMSVSEMSRHAEQVPTFRDGGIGRYPDNGFIHVDARGYHKRWTTKVDKEQPSEVAFQIAHTAALEEILRERLRQDEKWGPLPRPYGALLLESHPDFVWLGILMEEVGELSKAIIENKNDDRTKELTQVAAVGMAWLTDLKARKEA
jgi:hypothetical protein